MEKEQRKAEVRLKDARKKLSTTQAEVTAIEKSNSMAQVSFEYTVLSIIVKLPFMDAALFV